MVFYFLFFVVPWFSQKKLYKIIYGFQLKLHKLHGISGGCFESIDFLHKPGGFLKLYYPVMTGKMDLMATKRPCWKWFTRPGNLLQFAIENGDLVRGFTHSKWWIFP